MRRQEIDAVWYDDRDEYEEPPAYAIVVWLFILAACLGFWALVIAQGVPAVIRMVSR